MEKYGVQVSESPDGGASLSRDLRRSLKDWGGGCKLRGCRGVALGTRGSHWPPRRPRVPGGARGRASGLEGPRVLSDGGEESDGGTLTSHGRSGECVL
ncbi:hypothetical protein H6P81_017604 [Aristolochia fimbriata]|uniref:Uncharacterized protein n=1 Tax=Aristolochia fimbriata TaxID=158543 RepID=A0AAV7DYL4_ARIFI|nr:hypothetical protein H6P81_017604 [Aristolochia fimbriata]